MIVCDECGDPATRVRVKVGNRTLEKDLCQTHKREAFAGWRRAKRGRPRADS